MTKKELTPKEETFEALKTLMFYHRVYIEIKVHGFKFSDREILTKALIEDIEENVDIEEIKLSFKPEY